MLELTVDDRIGRSRIDGAVVLGDVDYLLACRCGFQRRRALDRHPCQAAAWAQQLKALPRSPVVVELISIAARPDQIGRGHVRRLSRGIDGGSGSMLHGTRHLGSLMEQRHLLMGSHYGASAGIAGNCRDATARRPRSGLSWRDRLLPGSG